MTAPLQTQSHDRCLPRPSPSRARSGLPLRAFVPVCLRACSGSTPRPLRSLDPCGMLSQRRPARTSTKKDSIFPTTSARPSQHHFPSSVPIRVHLWQNCLAAAYRIRLCTILRHCAPPCAGGAATPCILIFATHQDPAWPTYFSYRCRMSGSRRLAVGSPLIRSTSKSTFRRRYCEGAVDSK